MAEQTKQYMGDRQTDRLLADIARHEPTRAEIERAKAQSREILKRHIERVRATIK